MTLEDILTLSRAGYTAQQITALNQQSFQRPQPQNYPQMAQPQPQSQQMVQPYPQQMVQPQPQPQQMVQSYPQQMVQPQPQPQQMVQPQPGSNGQYTPVLPQNTTAPVQVDPMKDVMLEQYMNVPNMNMYDVRGVVADMIGANPPMNAANNTGGVK